VPDIEGLFSSPLLIIPDATHSKTEIRIRARGKTSARYMNAKEGASCEKENPEL